MLPLLPESTHASLCVSLFPVFETWGTFFCNKRKLNCEFNRPVVPPSPICIPNEDESCSVGKSVPYTADPSVPKYGGVVVCH